MDRGHTLSMIRVIEDWDRRFPRLVPKDAHVYDLAKRTLTNLYNERPTWLDLAHTALDEAVFGDWDPSMTDEQILAALLELNLELSESSDAAASPAETDAPEEGEPE